MKCPEKEVPLIMKLLSMKQSTNNDYWLHQPTYLRFSSSQEATVT